MHLGLYYSTQAVHTSLKYCYICESGCLCVAMWVLQWITVVPLATSAKPFSNIFKLSTTVSFKNARTIQINNLGYTKTTQALSIPIITATQQTHVHKHTHEHAHMCSDTDVWLSTSLLCFHKLLMRLAHMQKATNTQTQTRTHTYTEEWLRSAQ